MTDSGDRPPTGEHRPSMEPSPDAEELWARAVAGGSPTAIVGELLGALGRTTEAVAGGVARFARQALTEYREALVTPILDRLRTGTSLREDLLSLFHQLAGDETPSDVADQQARGGEVDPEQANQIEQAIASGIVHATRAGDVAPSQDTDVVAWALTSLIVTLAMRAREGDDTDELVAVATAAMEDLLKTPPAGPPTGGEERPTVSG